MAYLDHAATTSMRSEVVAAMTEQFEQLGNPSALHGAGRQARRTVEEAREALADALGADPNEVIFTGGGTEADNLAVKGIYWARNGADPARRRVLVSSVEHHAVLDAAHWLASHQGAVCEELPVDEFGRVTPDTLRSAIESNPDDVALVSVMWANNEVGTVQPTQELASIAAAHGIPFHSDAVQAIGQLQVRFDETSATGLSISGHKTGGPMGIGALLLRRGVDTVPVLHGGGQERDIRSGTLPTPLISGLAHAVQLATREREEHAARLTTLREKLVRSVMEAVPDAVLNGDPVHRLPGNAHFSFPECEGDALLMLLDANGVQCSTGSACAAGVAQASHVLLAMGAPTEIARCSLRFSLGRDSTPTDIDTLTSILPSAVSRARRARRR